jgi:hypothetical protein
MKALTICQPYGEAICRGLKRVENRTWPTDARGPLLIHAGKSRDWLDSWRTASHDWRRIMAFGAIVGRAELVDCVRIRALRAGKCGHDDLRYHEHAEGPWCWVLDSIERLERPFPCRGRQGLFDVSIEALEMEHGGPAIWLPAGPPAPRCRQCGCTEHSPCDEGCWWVEEDLCSACV